jgi:hypothetical protein
MASFEQQFYLENPTRWEALKRDTRLLFTLARYGILWLTKGARVRRAYRRARRDRRSLELDRLIDG